MTDMFVDLKVYVPVEDWEQSLEYAAVAADILSVLNSPLPAKLEVLAPKPMSLRGRRIVVEGGTRAKHTRDYRNRCRNYGPSVYCWDDRWFDAYTFHTKAAAARYSKDALLDEALDIMVDKVMDLYEVKPPLYANHVWDWEKTREMQDYAELLFDCKLPIHIDWEDSFDILLAKC